MLNRIPFHFRITILYIVIGALWIILSDHYVVHFTSDPDLILQLSTWKGWLFVLATGIMLFYLVFNELKRRNRIESELRIAKEKADEADRLKTSFLSNLSHYIRTPMNSILGFIELIEEKDTSPERHQAFLSYISKSSQNLLETLTSIIELSKIQEGQVRLNNQDTLLNELIERAAVLGRVKISELKKPVHISLKPGLPSDHDHIFADPDKVFLILSNLLANAITYTRIGTIEIGYIQTGMDIRLWVKDSGPGVPLEKKRYLFSYFLHNAEHASNSDEGTGLGLTLSSRLATLLGGNLWLDCSGPDGSTFCFSFPRMARDHTL